MKPASVLRRAEHVLQLGAVAVGPHWEVPRQAISWIWTWGKRGERGSGPK